MFFSFFEWQDRYVNNTQGNISQLEYHINLTTKHFYKITPK